MNVKTMTKTVEKFVRKNGPSILIGMGVTASVSAVVMAVKATPKALDICKTLERETDGTPTRVEYVKATWKCYAPAVATEALAIACVLSAHSMNLSRNAALATAYTLSESARKEYREKVLEKIGEKKETEIRDEIAQDRVNKTPFEETTVIRTGRGDTWFLDGMSGRYFQSDLEYIRKKVNDLNFQLLNENWIMLNEFYDAIDLDHIKAGDKLCWDSQEGKIDIHYSSTIMPNGKPCIVLEYDVCILPFN